MNKRNVLCILLMISLPFATMSQVEEDANEGIEQWIENEESTADYQDLMEQLAYGKYKKINLNNCNYADLSSILFLNPAQILAILQHRKTNGPFISVYELQAVEGLYTSIIKQILPFVYVQNSPFDLFITHNMFDKKWKQELILTYGRRLELAAGFLPNDSGQTAFIGNADRYVIRYRGNYLNRLSFGFNLEKDPGEVIFSDHNPNGFDFQSAHLFYKGSSKQLVREIAIGDFQAAFGQGLSFGSGLGFSKSAYVLNIKRNNMGLRPYRSLNENDFLRGVGIGLGYKNWQGTLFYAFNNLNANSSFDDSVQTTFIFNINSTGLHRTAQEISQKNQVKRRIMGANLNYQYKGFQMGFTMVQTQYEGIFTPNLQPYNLHRFSGNQLLNAGINYSYQFNNLLFWGEMSGNQLLFSNFSQTHGAILSLGKKLDIALLHRNLSPKYQTTYSTAFAESSNVQNENGTYMGFSWKPKYKWTVLAYYDMYRFGWLRYRMDAPAGGTDFLTEIQYSERRSFDCYLRFRIRQREINELKPDNKLNQLAQTHKQQLRLHLTYYINPNVTLKTRIEHMLFERTMQQPIQGNLAFIDLSYAMSSLKSKLYMRYTVFNIDGFDARIYAFENDMRYSFSVPAYLNKGTRFYLMWRSKLNKHLDFWLRIARTNYSNINSIGTGNNRIEGNILTDFRCQLHVKF
jgi:hypothetical protein